MAPSAKSPVLYPTVAVSDAFNFAGHAAAAALVWHAHRPAALGFLLVAAAAAAGTARFAVFGENSASARLNDDLANVAAFVGLPCVGLSFALANPPLCQLVAPLADCMLPAAHTVQLLRPSLAENAPGGQLSGERDCRRQYEPASQVVHALAPLLLWYVPSGQGCGVDEPRGQ